MALALVSVGDLVRNMAVETTSWTTDKCILFYIRCHCKGHSGRSCICWVKCTGHLLQIYIITIWKLVPYNGDITANQLNQYISWCKLDDARNKGACRNALQISIALKQFDDSRYFKCDKNILFESNIGYNHRQDFHMVARIGWTVVVCAIFYSDRTARSITKRTMHRIWIIRKSSYLNGRRSPLVNG